ncbi:MAG: DUF4105 domain-containing protein [Methyloprofundus sp.]|nr:DUF4105 domain-containing protein [Methyloprofundus sp.]
MSILLKTLNIFYIIFVCFFLLWSAPAVYFFKLFSEASLNLMLASSYTVLTLLLPFIIKNKRYRRSFTLSLFIVILIAWSQIQATHHKVWADSVAKLPSVTIDNNKIHIHNIRDFIYKTETDYQINYLDKSYDIRDLTELDYILSYWDGNKAIAHTMFSFGFNNGEHLVISVEVRHKKGEEYGGFAGLYKQFELIYVLATERDILQLRTNFRQEDVYRYPLNISQEIIHELFNIVISRVNSLHETAEFYNTLSQNCLTSLAADFWSIGGQNNHFDYRMLANGYSDAMLYQRNRLKSSAPFLEMKQQANINQHIKINHYNPLYSQQIRP